MYMYSKSSVYSYVQETGQDDEVRCRRRMVHAAEMIDETTKVDGGMEVDLQQSPCGGRPAGRRYVPRRLAWPDTARWRSYHV